MWPRQIASDLSRFHRRRIAEWHHGTLSSFELLELFGVDVTEDYDAKVVTVRVDFTPDDGALAAALRNGDRPEWQQMAVQSANELAVLRAAWVPGAQADEYGSRLFFPVDRLREFAAEQQRAQADRQALNSGQIDDDSMYWLWNQREVS